MDLVADTVLEIIAQGAWNGGNLIDNSIYENKGLTFKGGIPVNKKTIEERIGVRTRMAAPQKERIGVLAFKDLLQTSNIDPSRIKLIIGATNIGEDKFDPGPLIRHPFKFVQGVCPQALVLDLYAGCPGFNVSVELVFMMSLTGILNRGIYRSLSVQRMCIALKPSRLTTQLILSLVTMPWPPCLKPKC